MNILSFGGDRRIHEALRLFRAAGYGVQLYPETGEDAEILFLPFPVTRDGEHLNNSERTPLGEAEKFLAGAKYVFGGNIPPVFRRSGTVSADLMQIDGFVRENARLTAEGALKTLIGLCDRSLSDCVVGIIGYGRIASSLSLMLLSLGCRVKIYTSREHIRVALGTVGISTSSVSYDGAEGTDLSDVDIVVNTAPAPALRAQTLATLPACAPILELASGNNIEEDGIHKVVREMGIPGRVVPLSAGKLIYEYSREILEGSDAPATER